MENRKTPHYSPEPLKSPTKGILQKSHDYEEHETPEHKLETSRSLKAVDTKSRHKLE